ncbi:polysaccharide lyase family 8 super-sandwich domain-containing protein [Bacteroides nordii]|uniref:polysaccharide lyase family 8 super-sandwich domain-containing protein n=1 Tax=Bacteroides nordii TaxID=291645 RepID=UPI00399BE2E9
MKKIIVILFGILVTVSMKSQTLFTFEDVIPSDWMVTGGQLALTAVTYKEGKSSLEWMANTNSNISFPLAFKALSTNGTFFYIYSPRVTNDTITISFINGNTVKRRANVLCNFVGWREFNRTYVEYKTKTATNITQVEIALKLNKNVAGSRRILFDNMEFNNLTNLEMKIHGPHMVLDREYLKGRTSYLELYAFERDIPISQPSFEELADLALIRERQHRILTTPTTLQVRRALDFVNALNIVENMDGTLCGKIIDTTYGALNDSYIQSIFVHLANLSKAGIYQEMFLRAVRYILDQGIGEGCNYEMSSTMNFYTAGKEIPAAVLDVAYACEGDLRQRLLDFVQWFCYYNEAYRPEETYKVNLVSDYVYLYLPHFLAIAALQTDDAVAVRELKAVKRYIERNTEYTPGSKGILKSDGTGFHHNTHYNNYMYSYMPWTQCMWGLRGTSFCIAEDAYERFKKAVLSVYIMATKSFLDGNHFFSNTFAGRNCFGGGISLEYSREHFKQLIETGDDIKGNDEELKAAYNYFFENSDYTVDAVDYAGFYAFNYSPAAIFRKKNWVVSMRSITSKFWGAEIYSGQNRFGRYQSHGSLDVLYDGSLAANGYPTNNAVGGWDWNVVPGTTTVHYTSWLDMMPAQSTTQRFDQYSKEKNFSGALAMDSNGIFATDFSQIDKWGNTECYLPTNLEFKKSMFAFGDMIICMGSDITSSGMYSDDMITATNLFQNIVTDYVGDLVVNGEMAIQGESRIMGDNDNWFITPAGTGYFVPKGNDPIVLAYGEQTTPSQTGADYASPTGTAMAAKAYIDHGVKPTGAKDIFVVIPSVTVPKMIALSQQLQNHGGELFRVEAQSANLHALTYLPGNTTAYAFFDAVDGLDFGIVKATTFRHLLMVHQDAVKNRYKFAVCNPDLCPEDDVSYGWHSTSSSTTLTVNGNWELVEPVDGVTICSNSQAETLISVTMNDGAPIYFELKTPDDTGLKECDSWEDNIRVKKVLGGVQLIFNNRVRSQTNVKMISMDGRVLFDSLFSGENLEYFIPNSSLLRGVNIIQVVRDGKMKVIKFIF